MATAGPTGDGGMKGWIVGVTRFRDHAVVTFDVEGGGSEGGRVGGAKKAETGGNGGGNGGGVPQDGDKAWSQGMGMASTAGGGVFPKTGGVVCISEGGWGRFGGGVVGKPTGMHGTGSSITGGCLSRKRDLGSLTRVSSGSSSGSGSALAYSNSKNV